MFSSRRPNLTTSVVKISIVSLCRSRRREIRGRTLVLLFVHPPTQIRQAIDNFTTLFANFPSLKQNLFRSGHIFEARLLPSTSSSTVYRFWFCLSHTAAAARYLEIVCVGIQAEQALVSIYDIPFWLLDFNQCTENKTQTLTWKTNRLDRNKVFHTLSFPCEVQREGAKV